MSRFFLNFSPFPGFSRSYLNDGNSLSSPTPKPEIRTRRRPGSNAPQSRPLSVLTYYFPTRSSFTTHSQCPPIGNISTGRTRVAR